MGDTNSYENVAKMPLLDLNFYTNGRPFTFPLVMKICNYNYYEILNFQVVFSMISWVFLAFVISKLFKSNHIKYLIYISTLVLSLSVSITQWDIIILTESTSISLFVIFIGLNILFFTTEKLSKKILFLLIIIVGILFSFDRNSNMYIILQTAIEYLILFIVFNFLKYKNLINIKNQPISYPILALIFFVIYKIEEHLTKLSFCTNLCLENIFGFRILTNEHHINYFVTKWSMPFDNDTLQCVGQFGFDNNGPWGYANKSDLVYWIQYTGLEAYKSFLLSHSIEVISIYLGLFPKSLNYQMPDYYPYFYSSFFSIAQKIFYSQIWDKLFFVSLAFLGGLLFLTVKRPRFIYSYSANYLIAISLFLASFGQVFIGYFADSNDIERHSILASISFKLAFILLSFSIIEIKQIEYFKKFASIKISSIILIIIFLVGIWADNAAHTEPNWNTSSASIVVDNAGKTEAWLKGEDNDLWVNINGHWFSMSGGGFLTSDPFATKDYNGKIHVIVRGDDYAAWDFIYDPITANGHWKYLGGFFFNESLTATMDPINHNIMKIAAISSDNALWLCDLDINTEDYAWTHQNADYKINF